MSMQLCCTSEENVKQELNEDCVWTVVSAKQSHDRFDIIHLQRVKTSIIILPLTHFREMLWTRTPLNWREVEGCESHEWKEQHTKTLPNSSIRHQK